MNSDGNGNYHVRMNKDITATTNIKISDEIISSYSTIYSFLDIAFTNHRTVYTLVRNEYVNHSTFIGSLSLTDMSYNVDLNTCFIL